MTLLSDMDDVVPRPVLVMTRIATRPDEMAALLEMAEENAPLLLRQPGFLGSEVFKSDDDTRLVTLLRWRSAADYEACAKSPDLAGPNERLQALLDAGRIDFEAHVIARVGTVEAGAPPEDLSP